MWPGWHSQYNNSLLAGMIWFQNFFFWGGGTDFPQPSTMIHPASCKMDARAVSLGWSSRGMAFWPHSWSSTEIKETADLHLYSSLPPSRMPSWRVIGQILCLPLPSTRSTKSRISSPCRTVVVDHKIPLHFLTVPILLKIPDVYYVGLRAGIIKLLLYCNFMFCWPCILV